MKIRLAYAALPLVFVACQSAEPRPDDPARLRTVDELSAQGRYEEALLAAEAYHQSRPDDPEGEREWRRAKAAVLLEQARVLCFKEQNQEALELIRQARQIEPEEKVIVDWEQKMQRKLAEKHSVNGDEFFSSSNMKPR